MVLRAAFDGGLLMEVLQVTSELEPMVALYKERKPKRVLEIGCWDGGTLKEWLTRGTPEVVVAVDLEHRNRDQYSQWRHADTSLYVYAGESQKTEQIASMWMHAPYDWVFIDGDHGAWGVSTDVETCLPMIREGGLLLLHDIQGGSNHEDIYPPRIEFEKLSASGYQTWEWVDPASMSWAHGIGVVQL